MIYVVSKTRHAPRWLKYRAEGVPIISTWIDQAEAVQAEECDDLWIRCLDEVRRSKVLVVYLEPGDVLKGGLAEIGAGLVTGKSVLLSVPDILADDREAFQTIINEAGLKTLHRHNRVFLCPTIALTMQTARRFCTL